VAKFSTKERLGALRPAPSKIFEMDGVAKIEAEGPVGRRVLSERRARNRRRLPQKRVPKSLAICFEWGALTFSTRKGGGCRRSLSDLHKWFWGGATNTWAMCLGKRAARPGLSTKGGKRRGSPRPSLKGGYRRAKENLKDSAAKHSLYAHRKPALAVGRNKRESRRSDYRARPATVRNNKRSS